MKVKCFDRDCKIKLDESILPIRLFESTPAQNWGAAGSSCARRIRIERLQPTEFVRDFFRLGLGVVAADRGVLRNKSQDGWTREIELEVPVENPAIFENLAPRLEKMLRFLTGDLWQLTFTQSEYSLIDKSKEPRYLPGRTVSLLSGGADSLVGALDLKAKNERYTAVSQTSSESTVQKLFALKTKAERHLAWTHGVHLPCIAEGSQRARSIGFFAFAIFAAASTEAYHEGDSVDLHASENGLISINPPLTPSRIGSASTRTTHPTFIKQLQTVLDDMNVRVKLVNNYQFMTKGEMLSKCTEQKELRALLKQSMSCGKSGRINMHCGRCVPCIIRRAAFHSSGLRDSTIYKFGPKSDLEGFKSSDDVRCAFVGSQNWNDRSWIERVALPPLYEHDVQDRKALLDVVQRGLREVNIYLRKALK